MNRAKPFRVALTGGIASGKSTVAELFAAQGVPVIDLDEIARVVVAPGTALLQRVLARFGPAVRASDGALDRRALRDVVFADPSARRELEALLHPAILERAGQRSALAGGPYQLIVVPLLTEISAADRYDRVLLVDCDESVQRARLMGRDGASAAQADAALAAQATRAARRAVASDVIENGGERGALAAQVHRLHAQYLALARGD